MTAYNDLTKEIKWNTIGTLGSRDWNDQEYTFLRLSFEKLWDECGHSAATRWFNHFILV
jgi:hypothetical protein